MRIDTLELDTPSVRFGLVIGFCCGMMLGSVLAVILLAIGGAL